MTDTEHIRAMLERVLHMQGSQAVEIGQMHGKIAKLYELVERVANDQLRRASLCAQHAKALSDNAHAIQSLAREQVQATTMNAAEITGPHDLAALHEIVEARKWWREKWAGVMFAVLTAVIIASALGCAGIVYQEFRRGGVVAAPGK